MALFNITYFSNVKTRDLMAPLAHPRTMVKYFSVLEVLTILWGLVGGEKGKNDLPLKSHHLIDMCISTDLHSLIKNCVYANEKIASF